ncbi:hypothetical protein SUDANB106_00248 [Streptomyces sp. enrichment culture]|uniref:hypothetical protein n=1 Tax=Streptomyces sp. enrichment culture TaxID=1795815 RepID=UPI003F5574CA
MTQRPVGLVFPGPGRPRQAVGGFRRGPLSRDVTAGISQSTGEDLPEPPLRTPAGRLRRVGLARLSVRAGAVTAPCGAVRCEATGRPVAACAGRRPGGYTALAAGALTVGPRDTASAPRRRPGVTNAAARPYGGDRTGAAARRLTSPTGREQSVRAHTGPLGCRRPAAPEPDGGSRARLIRRTVQDIEAVSGDSPGALD